jgi:DNA-binding NtrC family response regulator
MYDDSKTVDLPGQRAINEGNEEIGDTLEGLTSLASALLNEVEKLLPPAAFNVKDGIDFYHEVEKFEIDLIQRALDRTGGHQVRAASLLKIKITTLNTKIKRYHIAHGSVAT